MRQFAHRPRRTRRRPSSPALIVATVLTLLLAAASPAPSLAQNVPPPAAPASPTQPAPAELTAGDSTRLIWGPTGRTLKPGEFYVAGYALMLPFVQVGVTNRFSIGAGMPLFSIGSDEAVFWVTPKFQVHRSARTSVSVGAASSSPSYLTYLTYPSYLTYLSTKAPADRASVSRRRASPSAWR